MSDIKVGDLVVVLRDCCSNDAVGKILSVERIGSGETENFGCSNCGIRLYGPFAEWTNKWGCRWGRPLSWLKRIPPLEELEGEKRDERIEA